MLSFAIDFDGTLAEGTPLKLRPGAAQALRAFKKSGHHLVLFSARCTPLDPAPALDDEIGRFYETGAVAPRVTDQWARFEEMRAFLRRYQLWDLFDEIWQSPGKPHVNFFVDDLAEQPDWGSLVSQFGVQSKRDV